MHTVMLYRKNVNTTNNITNLHNNFHPQYLTRTHNRVAKGIVSRKAFSASVF